MTKDEFVSKAVSAGLSPDDIKSAMNDRRSSIGAFDDEVVDMPQEQANIHSLGEALLPRSAKSRDEGRNKFVSNALDVLSLPGRAITGVSHGLGALVEGKSLQKAYNEAKQSSGNIEPDKNSSTPQRFVEGLLKDPATAATLLIGGPVSGGIKWAISQGLKQGLVSAATHQTENANNGNAPNIGQAALEIGGGGILGGVGRLAGNAIESAGKTIKDIGAQNINAIIRPGKIGAKDGFKTSTMINHDLIGKNIEEMQQKTESKLSDLNRQLDQIRQDGSDMGATIDGNNLYANVVDKISGSDKEFDKAAMDKVFTNEIEPVLQKFQNQDGTINLVDAMKLKTQAGTKGAWYQKGGGKRVDPDATAKEAAYNALYSELKENINQVIKENDLGTIEEINKQFMDIIPVARAIERRIPIATSNLPISLSDVVAGTGGAAMGALSGDNSSMPSWTRAPLAAGSMILLNKASKSPILGKAAYNLGEAIEGPLIKIAKSRFNEMGGRLGSQAARNYLGNNN
jgi:hypothetical protein